MKSFLKEHSYDAVKMFLNQFATAIFGVSLSMATTAAHNPVLRNISSIFAVLFYLFLLYSMAWELGYKDMIPIKKERKPYRPFTGFYISIIANIQNFILALIIMLGSLTKISFFNQIGPGVTVFTNFYEGMYCGLLLNKINNVALSSFWWIYFLLPLPAIFFSSVAYVFGTKDIKFTGLFKFQYPESDREPKRKKKDDE